MRVGTYKWDFGRADHNDTNGHWMICDGRLLLDADRPDLVAVFGVTFGGNAGTDFCLPGVRGYGLMMENNANLDEGRDNARAVRTRADRVGLETHILSNSEMPVHDHPSGASALASDWNNQGAGTVVVANGGTKTGVAGGDQPHNIMHPTAVVGNLFVLASESAIGGTVTDPNFSSVVLLAPFGTVIDDDASNSNHVLTAVGNAAIVSNLLDMDGDGDAVSAPDSTDWDFGTGDFTMEAFIDSDTEKLSTVIFSTAPSNGSGGWFFDFGYNNGMALWANGAFRITVGTGHLLTAAEGTAHLALTREGNTLRMFKDGVQQGSDATYTGAVDTSATAGLRIGNYTNEALFGIDGRVSNARITKGVARYTANFTPPTEPLPTS